MNTITSPVFGVRSKGRLYPKGQFKSQPADNCPPEETADLSHQELKQQLVDAIWNRLPYVREPERPTDVVSLFSIYVQSISVIESSRLDVLQLLQTMMETSVEVDPSISMAAEAGRAIQAKLAKEISIRIDSPQNLASADLAARPRTEIEQILENGLHVAVQKLVTQVVDGLGVLVDRSVAGLVHWTGPNTVKYHFFRRRFTGDSYELRTVRGPIRPRAADDDPRDSRRLMQRHITTTSSNLVCFLAHHRHHAVEAFHTTIENSKVVMPPFVQTLVCAIPDWMRPIVKVIDGHLIREEITQHELDRERIVRTETFDEPLQGPEPAVVLGPFVLTGWGPFEIEAELNRRSAMQPTAVPNDLSFLVSCAVGGQVLAALLFRTAATTPALKGLVILALAAGLYFAFSAFRMFLKQKQPSINELQLTLSLISVAVGAGGFQIAVADLPVWKSILGCIVMILGISALLVQHKTIFFSHNLTGVKK